MSISSTFLRTNFLAVFSSYVLALAKNSYKKCGRLTLMKLTKGVNVLQCDEKQTHVLLNGHLDAATPSLKTGV